MQKSASIQPRTSPSKFGGKFNSVFTSLLKAVAEHSPIEAPFAQDVLATVAAHLAIIDKAVTTVVATRIAVEQVRGTH